ncbi:hypothetical protein EGT66_28815 [Burkholderia mallei]|nr:hypothetical protein EGT66_28815 [Burkholderia mallei]
MSGVGVSAGAAAPDAGEGDAAAARSRFGSAANGRARSRSSAPPSYRDGTLRLPIVYLASLSFTVFSSKTIGAIERAADRSRCKATPRTAMRRLNRSNAACMRRLRRRAARAP